MTFFARPFRRNGASRARQGVSGCGGVPLEAPAAPGQLALPTTGSFFAWMAALAAVRDSIRNRPPPMQRGTRTRLRLVLLALAVLGLYASGWSTRRLTSIGTRSCSHSRRSRLPPRDAISRAAAAALLRNARDGRARLVSPNGRVRHGDGPEGVAARRTGGANPVGSHRRDRRPADVFHRQADLSERPVGVLRRGASCADAGSRHPQPPRDGLHLPCRVRDGMAAVPLDLSRAATAGLVVSRHGVAGARLFQLHRLDDHDAALRPRDAARALDHVGVRSGGRMRLPSRDFSALCSCCRRGSCTTGRSSPIRWVAIRSGSPPAPEGP